MCRPSPSRLLRSDLIHTLSSLEESLQVELERTAAQQQHVYSHIVDECGTCVNGRQLGATRGPGSKLIGADQPRGIAYGDYLLQKLPEAL